MNVFDQFVKQDIKCRHYGRYVDDSTMIDTDKEWLLKQVPKVREFLDDELGLQLHMGKLHIQEIHKASSFWVHLSNLIVTISATRHWSASKRSCNILTCETQKKRTEPLTVIWAY